MFVRAMLLAGLLVSGTSGTAAALDLLLNAPPSGATAPYELAREGGLFAAEGLVVTIRHVESSRDVISRVAVGAAPAGIADMPSVIGHLNDNPGSTVMAVMVLHDRPAHAVIARAGAGITGLDDLIDRRLGLSIGDESAEVFNGYVADAMIGAARIERVDLAPGALPRALAEGRVDAIVAPLFAVLPELAALGLDGDQLHVLRLSNEGMRHYGDVLVINTGQASPGGATVERLIKGMIAGWRASIADPDAAIAALVSTNGNLDPAQERARLDLVIAESVLTEWVRENGMGDLHYGRIEGSIAQLQVLSEFIVPIDVYDFFDARHLPAARQRMIDR